MEQQQHGGLLSPPELSPLEQEVLDEYERLSTNMKTLATLLDNLASKPTVGILDGLRELERKTSLAFTLLKASVYSIVLQQEIDWGAGGEEQGGEEKEETKVEEEEDEEEEQL
ncbi:DASH complex subunit Dad3 domain-containing protein [Trichoderma compactum]